MGVDRTWLKVPYGKKELAKQHGAEWSFKHQQWYILNPVSLKLSREWIDNGKAETKEG